MVQKRSANIRLDKALVDYGFARSRDHALELILSSVVLVNGSIAQKASRNLRPSDQILVRAHADHYVGRGAYKLLGALDDLEISVAGKVVADLGSSTGGFTQVLLERGAQCVVAIDVGANQMSERLRKNPQIVLLEKVNARTLDRSNVSLPEIDFVVGDLSFISLNLLRETVKDVLLGGIGDFLLLVKPQFELDRKVVSKGKGVIRDPELWRQALLEVATKYVLSGAQIKACVASHLTGSMGNREFFIYGTYKAQDSISCITGELPELIALAIDKIASND